MMQVALAISFAFVGAGVLSVLLVISLVAQDRYDAYKAQQADKAMQRVIESQMEKQPR